MYSYSPLYTNGHVDPSVTHGYHFTNKIQSKHRQRVNRILYGYISVFYGLCKLKSSICLVISPLKVTLIVTLSEAMTKLAVSLSTAPGCLTMNTSFTAPQQLNNRFNEP